MPTILVLSLAGCAAALQVGSRTSVMPSRVSVARMQTQAPTKAAPGSAVDSLLNANRARIDSMASIAPDMSEIQRLRFALAFSDQSESTAALRETVAWRGGKGSAIVASAAEAVAKAMEGGKWDNEPVRAAAPYAAAINPYITPKNILTISTAEGDLVYVVRASAIEDKELMSKVSPDQLCDYLLYVKEVHSLVANARSLRTGRLCQVVFANDISGTRKPPDPKFSEALTASSKQYEKLYPSLAGPTMILNLPFVLQAFIGLFKPLFPKSVQARLKFVGAPVLAKLKDLTPLTTDPRTRDAFLAEMATLLR